MKINLTKELYFLLKNISWKVTCENSTEWKAIYSLCNRAGLYCDNISADKNNYPVIIFSNGIGGVYYGDCNYKDITDLFFPKPLKISDKLKSRLLKKNWLVVCDTEEKFDMLMKVCDTIGITWNDSFPAPSWKPELEDFFYCIICFGKDRWYEGITIAYTLNEIDEENISDMVFSEILNKEF